MPTSADIMEMLLYVATSRPLDDQLKETADELIIQQIIFNHYDEETEELNITDEEIKQEYTSLITGHILREGVANGTVDTVIAEDGEILYKISKEGVDLIRNLKGTPKNHES